MESLWIRCLWGCDLTPGMEVDLLPCLHVACSSTCSSKSNAVKECPGCSRELVPEQIKRKVKLDHSPSTEMLLKNFHLWCEYCVLKRPASSFCKQCNKMLCQLCIQFHGKLKMFKGHDLVTNRTEMRKKLLDPTQDTEWPTGLNKRHMFENPAPHLPAIDTSQRCRRNNPMEISVILQTLFRFCSVETLKTCRLVSRQWREHSLKSWREKAVLQCGFNDTYDDKFELMYYSELFESDDDDTEFWKLKQYPFKRLSLICFDRLSEIDGVSLRRISTEVTQLNIITGLVDKRGICELKEFLSNFPSLENLCCELFYDDEVTANEPEHYPPSIVLSKVTRFEMRFGDSMPTETSHCLDWLPSLEALSVIVSDYHGEDESREYLLHTLRTVKRIRQSEGGGKMHLKELEVLASPETDNYKLVAKSPEIIGILLACKFPLVRLTITLVWKEMYELLNSYKDTLQYLKTSYNQNPGDGYDFKHERKQICLEKLKEVNLGKGSEHSLHLLSHLDLPNLEELIVQQQGITDKYTRNLAIIFPNGRVYRRMENLDFQDATMTPSPRMIEAFVRIMPNLAHLQIPLDKTTFQIVCKRLKGLKTFNILSAKMDHEELDDESITGISKYVAGSGGNAENPMRRPPNITDLTCLTDLKISCESQLRRNDVKFTDHAVIYGFLQLPKLYSLSVAFRDISVSAQARLTDHVKGCLNIQAKSSCSYYSPMLIETGEDGDDGDVERFRTFNS